MSEVAKWLGKVGRTVRRSFRAVSSRWSKTRRTRSKWRRGIFGAVAFLAGVAAILTLIVMLGGIGPLRAGGGAEGGGDGSWTDLRLHRPVALTDGEEPSRVIIGNTSRWAISKMPQIDFTIRNEGGGRIPLGRVRIEVVDSARITPCLPPQGGEGAIPVAESFFVDLPLLPVPGEQVVYRQLHYEVPSWRAARFKLYFRSLEGAGDDLFAIHVSLTGPRADQKLDIGRFVLSLPGAVPRQDAFLPESTESLKLADDSLLPTTWCFRRNLAVVRRFLSIPGARSPAMKALSLVHMPPGWDRLADPRPPRLVVEPLLQSGDFFLGPVLAEFAARRTGDPKLLAATQKREARLLRHTVESSLAQGSPLSPTDLSVDAHVLAQVAPSDEASILLERSRAALRQSEVAATAGVG
jgi:hypothetical protein